MPILNPSTGERSAAVDTGGRERIRDCLPRAYVANGGCDLNLTGHNVPAGIVSLLVTLNFTSAALLKLLAISRKA
jgi:hypothetical protein